MTSTVSDNNFDGMFSVTRIRTFYLYEFLLAISVITMIFQMIGLMESTVEKEELQGVDNSEIRKLPLDAPIGPSFGKRPIAQSDVANITNFEPTFMCQNETMSSLRILVFGGLKVIRQWQELNVLVNTFKPRDKVSYSFDVKCSYNTKITTDVLNEEEPKAIECPNNITVILSSNVNEINENDIIVLGMSPYSLKIKTNILRKRVSDNQLFLFYGVETPLRMHEWISDIGRQPVHAVWSYHSSSEMVMPYGRYREFPNDRDVNIDEIIIKKTKLISWMSSNCVKQVYWPRMAFVSELQKYIAVDTYGKCGNLTCLPRMSKRCQSLMGEYKFYLSLENAECRDYMTEKFWDTGLLQGAVPVVYGATKEDYERVAPPGSFIHVSDFESVESLAKYLLLLDRNEVLYRKYFHWRRKGEIQMVFPPLVPESFCDVITHYHRLQRGQLEARALEESPWYQGCRFKVAKSYPLEDFTNWRAWR